MAGPGQYVADVTEGIIRVEDLPKPRIVKRSRNYKHRRCADCEHSSYRVRTVVRTLHDLDDPAIRRSIGLGISRSPTPNTIVVDATSTSTRPWAILPCPRATTLTGWSAWPSGSSSKMVSHTEPRPGIYGATTVSSSPLPRFRTGLRRGGKRAAANIDGDYLEQVLAKFSGYIAVDEVYDGPFCVLFIVDNHTFQRIAYEVLDHDPTHEDIKRFFRHFRAVLDARGLEVVGVTTDGSPLYPTPIQEVFGDVSHPICTFHVLAELTKAILRAVAKIRKELAFKKPKLPRGRPSRANRALARRKKQLEAKITELFDHRYLFVQHDLTPAEKKKVIRISRGLPHLRTLRDIMDEVYRLFDRRCRTATALKKLAKLRARVRRFKKIGKTLSKLSSPNLEKALVFLDDSLLPATSNAVERSNRRHRKMQKNIYSVRTQEHVRQRIALDMERDAHGAEQRKTISALHLARTG